MESKKRRSIRGRTLKTVLGIALFSLVITSVFGVLSMFGIQKEAEDALIEQAKTDLSKTLETKTLLAEQRLIKYTEIVKEFTYYVEDIIAAPEKFDHLDLDSMETYDTGDLVFSFALANEELDWSRFKGDTEVFANIAHRFYPTVAENRNVIQTTYFGFDNGLLLSYDDASEFVPPQIMYYNYFDSNWYDLGKNSDKPVFTEAYIDSFGRGITITCVAPIHDRDGKVIGALGMDMGITDLYDYILDLDLGDGASAYIMDKEGNFITLDDTGADGAADPILQSSDAERMENYSNGLVVRNNMFYAFSTIDSVDWKLCVRVPESQVLLLAERIEKDIISTIILFTVFFLIILSTVVIVAFNFSGTITKPIIDLKKDVGEISGGDLNHRAEVYDNDEIGDLAESFNEMASSLKEHIETITQVTADKERITAELDIATKMQADMLPKNFPKRSDLELFATMTPAREMGGDFYDFFMIDDDHLGLVMADVSGKGVPAAMFMIVAKTLIKIRTTAPGTPAQMLWDINNTLCADNPSALFVTAWFGILTLSTGELISANAGHEYPALMHEGGDYELLISENMPPLASAENIEYYDEKMTLQKGDRLFLYTDGVPEAKNGSAERFGRERMLEMLNRNKNAAPDELLEKVKSEVDSFTGDNAPFDDITMMSVVRKG